MLLSFTNDKNAAESNNAVCIWSNCVHQGFDSVKWILLFNAMCCNPSGALLSVVKMAGE